MQNFSQFVCFQVPLTYDTIWDRCSVTWLDVGSETDRTMSVAVEDVDKDGDLDVIVGNFETDDFVYFGKGDGTFESPLAVEPPPKARENLGFYEGSYILIDGSFDRPAISEIAS